MSSLSQHAGKITAGAVASGLLLAAVMLEMRAHNASVPIERFAFERVALRPADASGFRVIRPVHPDYNHIAAWISSVGASVALGDIDGDGLANDGCLVDPRNDTISIIPLQGQQRNVYPPFVLTTPPSGYDVAATAPTGCLFADANADGREDVVVYYWGRTPGIFENTGRMTGDGFVFHQIVAGSEVWFTNAAVFTDVDGDGFGDLLFGNYFPDESGVLDTTGRRPVQMQRSMSRAFNGGKDRLFINRGAQTGRFIFADRSNALDGDMTNGWTLALGAADLNHDGYPEVYVANDFGPDRLLLNRSRPGEPSFSVANGRRGFTDISSGVLGRDSFKGMGVDFADIDGDGGLDIYVSNIAEDYALLESHFVFLHQAGLTWEKGQAPYRNAAAELGLARSSWSWDSKLADLDNDGHYEALQAAGFIKGSRDRWPELQELAMGNDELLSEPASWPQFAAGDDLSGDRHDAFFVRGSDGRFHDVAPAVGLGQPGITRGIALADVDGDGDLDFALARQWEPSELVINLKGQDHYSLILDLRLKNPNGSTRPAIGAVATATLPDGRKLPVICDTSNGHSGHRSPEVHFGLGESTAGVRVTVSWRTGTGHHQRTFRLQPGRRRIVLDDSGPQYITFGHGRAE
ncbi:CRTAC1 family protein (plasmid) [Sinorhizobium meliloti]|uniref:CRTAC1 family protein n=1 Tax=Rhizobium meliloti TaxID=382 RepID=UPI000B4A1E31|nr:CRTAC1 family protein [Sinorhizobium meliloti]ASP73860.1 CRTAC1 family protein [Sinorhizobium meliloti]MDE3858113.1 CRTAC1 family protein [Sinorhizobium meliloti]MQW53404.1 RNA-binding protein [Sinorhizobium meliloti]